MRKPGWAVLKGAVAAAVAVVLLSGCASATPTVASAPPTASVTPFDTALRVQLEAALDAGFAASGMPGVIVGLWIPGQAEWVATRGVSDLATNEPMDRANQSKIGSITKTLVGQVALQLIGDGTVGLSLDDTIDRWYPKFPDAAEITLRMLMNMSSGIGPPGQTQLDRICDDPYSTITPDEMIAIGAATPREPYAPGEGNTYSGYNTFILGRILERTTGSDLATLIDEHLLRPLGMSRSRFAPDAELAEPFDRGYSEFCPQYPQPTDTTDWTNHEAWAAGAMLSTIDDLHTWGIALGEGYGLTPEMQTARLEDRAPGLSDTGYGYGLAVSVHVDPDSGCVLDVNHSGAEPGYGAHVQYFEGSRAVLALIGNGDGGTGEAFAEVLRALIPVLPESVAATSSTACLG
ncbi:D-alanyl-D-alanine carboxypeptidase [Agromyces sp. CF514]|uniref:serine hydrolase domain-containing protein n=1 Tax=Agromyces sp. CF514 TaxID=1881031 RepID=UPI0008E82A38|nr:serine hydrolase domain-containing protein [Agromyces sp. CF514]SFR71095.1 D-alanyl-D-alanine carboxypeptidase [Agromyces sp. CF514]